jgi:DHA2 family methylenomycin A resistance protein-like MFS transporter
MEDMMTAHTIPSRPTIPSIVVATTSLGFVVVQLDVSIVNVALVRMGEALHTGTDGLQWVVDAYTLAFASLLLAAGALGDRIGARLTFALGTALFTLASLACALAPHATSLIAARAVQGAGAAMLMPSSLSVLNHAAGKDGEARSRAIGVWTAAGGAALAAGPLLGGLMVDHLGWQSIFLINLPIGAIAIWLAWCFLDETEIAREPGGFDWPGQGLAILSLFAFTGAVIEAGPLGIEAPLVLAGLGIAVAAILAFVATEARSASPMLPLGLFRKPRFSVALLVGLAVNFTIYGVTFVLGFYFQRARHYSPAETGLAFLPFFATVIVANIVGGRIAAEHGARGPMILGLAIGAIGFALLTSVGADTSYVSLIARLVFVPIGIGLAVPPMTATLLSTVEKKRSGMASGILNTVRQAAGAIGVALFGALMSGDLVTGMRIAFGVSAGLLGVAAMACVFGIRKGG